MRPSRESGALLPPRLRSPLMGCVLLASSALVLLSVDVAGKSTSTRLDELLADPLPGWLLRYDVLKAAALHLPVLAPAAAVALSVGCWYRGLRRAALLALAGPAVAVAVTEVLKPLLGRPPTTGSGWMFPSGHVTAITAVASVGGVLLLPHGGLPKQRPWVRLAAWAAVVGAPAATCLGTIVKSYHYPTDVLGAVLVATASVVTVAAVLDRVAAAGPHGPVRRSCTGRARPSASPAEPRRSGARTTSGPERPGPPSQG